MKISDSLVEKLLIDAGKATAPKLESLKGQAKTEKTNLQAVVIADGLVSEAEITRLYAKEIDVPFADINPKELKQEILKIIPERIARRYKAVLFGVSDNGEELLAMEDPDDIQAISFLQKQLGSDIKVHIAPSSVIEKSLDQYDTENVTSDFTSVLDEESDNETEEEVSEDELTEDSPIAQTVNLIIEYAIKSGASDIHIEPRENHVLIRYRVDGILREANKLPKKVQGPLVSRVKILSNLKIDERRAPQDGRFKIQIGSDKFALRVSTLPIAEGEKVVMRILSESNKPATLEELGYWGSSLKAINDAMIQPHGMILVTGPTGSGKSTSLFSALSILNRPQVNISTVEDPVEYKIPGANQTQVNPKAGMTFASGLRALLRQDPNIIMVGEIRDSETADLGVQAALTGHLVFATLHTNNAATCLPRLLDMGVEPFLIASTIRAVVGQRLVRRLCIDCRQPYKPDGEELKKISDIFHINDIKTMSNIHSLEKQALDGGVGKSNEDKKAKTTVSELATSESTIKQLWKPAKDGCDVCGHTGYKGRVGIYEVLANNSGIERLIISSSTSDQIQDEAIKNGMITMQLDGFIKALRGQTSIEEILRVTSES